MDDEIASRIAQLKQKELRQSKIPALSAAWSSIGVVATQWPDEACQNAIARMRMPGSTQKRLSGTLDETTQAFAKSTQKVVILDWDIDEAPGLCIDSRALLSSIDKLHAIYLDGFILFDLSVTKALIVDYDDEEEDIYVDEVLIADQT